jgi:molybdopterin/thiamine biosynthesis adenylyltransferase
MPGPPENAIGLRAVKALLPTGVEGRTIAPDAVADIADDARLPGWDIEARALELGIVPTRYLRNMNTLSALDQARLLRARVAQVGLGGLGGTLFELFLRAGIGTLRVADGDMFEASNLNRQSLAANDTLGKNKTTAALASARRINPSATIDARTEFLTDKTLSPFLGGCDLAVDALGGLEHRLALQKAATDAGIPLVTGAIAGWTGYVGVVLPGQPGPAHFMGHDNGVEEKLGCPAPSVSVMASLMAVEAVKILTGSPSSIEGRLLVLDLKKLTFDTVSL